MGLTDKLDKLFSNTVKVECNGKYSFPQEGNVKYCDFPTDKQCKYFLHNTEFPILSKCLYKRTFLINREIWSRIEHD